MIGGNAHMFLDTDEGLEIRKLIAISELLMKLAGEDDGLLLLTSMLRKSVHRLEDAAFSEWGGHYLGAHDQMGEGEEAEKCLNELEAEMHEKRKPDAFTAVL